MVDVQVSEQHKVLLLPDSERLRRMIPVAKKLPGTDKIVVPHTREAVRLLRNMNIGAPAPIVHQYDWALGKPYQSQRETAALLTTNTRAYVLSEMGVGKTRAALFAADFLMQTKDVRRALVVGPLSTLQLVWANEIFQFFPNRSFSIVHGTREKRFKALKEDVDFFIVNHDGLHIIADKLKDIDLIIIDELTAFRTHNTRRWKALNSIVKKTKFAWGLTGSPRPNAPTDVWAQVKLLTPNNVPPYFKRFREQTMRQITQFKWIDKDEANDIVYAAMQPSVRFMRDDCFDLPPTTYTTRHADLSQEQSKFYKEIMTRLKVEYKEHRISAANEGVKLNKLLQVCGGYVYTDTDMRTLALNPAPRLAALKELLEETDRKVIVFCPFVHTVEQVYLFVKQHFTAAMIYGNTAVKDREKIFRSFMKSQDPRVLVAHPKTMSHGLTLTAANTVVWYLPAPSPEIYEQANARVTRPGQNSHTLIAHIASSSVEVRAYKRLQNKLSTQGVLLGMFDGVKEDAA